MSETKWTREQNLAINEKDSNILVAAAAGSGKTAVLVERIINKVINEKINIDKILVVTFTNAAASEMRERILDAIYKRLEDEKDNSHLQRQINLLNKASISTIHAFCLDVIRNNFFEIDTSANFRVGDTTEVELIKQEVIEDLFEQKYEEENKEFLSLIETYTNYRNDDKLKEIVLDIYKFIQSTPFPEKWITEKVEEFNYPINTDFASTKWGKIILKELFSQIEECILKLEKISKETSKFFELDKFTMVLQQDVENLKSLINPNLSWDKIYYLVNDFTWQKWPIDKKVTIDLKNEAKEIRDSVKKQFVKITSKVMIYTSQEANEDINSMYTILQNLSNLVLEFTDRFKQAKKEKNIIDFNDIEHLALDILVNKENLNEKTKVAKDYMKKFEEIDIDEYQDSNLVQEYILNSISRGDNIFMVGDVKQSIYRFRQARPELFLDKYERYKLEEQSKEDGEKIQLFKNFRSRKNILDITNNIFKNIMSKDIGEIEYTQNEYLNYGASYPEQKEKSEIYVIDLKEPEEDELSIVSKNYEKVSIQAPEKNTPNENENEQDEIDERIEDVVLEAKFVANKVKELLNSGMEIYDKKQGQRKISCRDIAILLRSTSNTAPIYEKELNELEIPVFSDSSSTYLESIEIETMMSLLKIIDNPMQDIPLVTVLRSTIGNFTDNDLIEIRLADKKCSFYEAMLKSRTKVDDEIKEKISKLLDNLDKWRKESEYLGLDELIWQIYLDTGYYHFVSLMPNGNVRQANLKILFEKAREFENTNFNGLFHFINFMDRLKGSGGDLSSAKLIGENEDVVRIMSIHKSKGLEFPIVFLCNTGKRFNMKDLNENIILHQDLGIGPKYVDTENRIEYNTLAKEALKIKAQKEIISEEERVLYVGLTRAKEKLIITGLSKDIKKELKEKEELLHIYENEVKSNLVEKYKSYLDWIELVYLHNDLEELVDFNIINKKEILKDLKEEKNNQRNVLKEINKMATQEYSKEKIEKLSKELDWVYKYKDSTILPTKTSVSRLKEASLENKEKKDIEKNKINEINRREINANENKTKESNTTIKIINVETANLFEDLNKNMEITLDKPKFLRDEKITRAQIGTLVHICIQKLDESKEYTLKDIQNFLNELVVKEIITEKEANCIDVGLLYKYTQSDIFNSLKKAKKVYKEQAFYINIPAVEIYNNINSDDNILVQGVIDLYFIDENDNAILIDYKTDYVANGKEQEIVDRYRKQIEIYKRALEEATGKKVFKSYLCLANRDWKCYEVK